MVAEIPPVESVFSDCSVSVINGPVLLCVLAGLVYVVVGLGCSVPFAVGGTHPMALEIGPRFSKSS
jgi:hypothetical protein